MCRLQLEGIYWLCFDSIDAVCANKLTKQEAETRREFILEQCKKGELLDFKLLNKARMIDDNNQTICPLCLEKLSGMGFFNRMAQAEGREVTDITVTEVNIFHIKELRYGSYHHRPYNVSWGDLPPEN